MKVQTSNSILNLERPIHSTLEHEFGAGAPCKNCSKCPGLNLHYWRKICTACYCKLDDHDIPKHDHKNCDIVICSLFGSKHHCHNLFFSENASILPHASRDWATSDGSESTTTVQSGNGHENPLASAFRRESSTTTSTSTSIGAENARSVDYSWQPPVILTQNSNHSKEEQTQTNDPNANEEAKRNFIQLISEAKEKHFGIAKAIQCDSQTFNNVSSPQVTETNHLQQHTSVISNDNEQRTKTINQCCGNCGNGLKAGDIGIFTSHGKPEGKFHQECFKCSTCEKLLTDLLYFFKDGKYFCGRHFGDANYPRCFACDELILTQEYTEADGHAFHNQHFCCSRCDTPLGGMKYVQKENDHLCFKCHNKLFSNKCNTCQQMIQPDETRLSHNEVFWHNKLACFRCASCNTPLVSRKFIFKHEKTFCSFECKTKFGY